MADATQQTETVQPTQPTQPELTALERAAAADNRTKVTLNAKQVIEQVSLFGSEAGEYSETSPIQGAFWRFKFGGAIITTSPDFKTAFDEGKIYSATFTPTLFERTVPDPNKAGASKQVVQQGWSLDAFSTIDQMKKAAITMKEAATIDLGMQLHEAKMKRAVEAVAAADLKKVITDEELTKMLAEV